MFYCKYIVFKMKIMKYIYEYLFIYDLNIGDIK